MKNLKLLVLLLAVSMAFVSCSKDKDEVTLVSGNTYETTYAKVTMLGVEVYEAKTKSDLQDVFEYVVLEFKEDGTLLTDV